MPIVVGGVPNPAPFAPTLLTPATASYLNLATTPEFSWVYNPAQVGRTQTGWALRRKISGAASYVFWDKSTAAWQSTLVYNTGATGSYTFAAGDWTDGRVYNWSVSTKDANGSSAFATDFTVNAQATPSVTVTSPAGTTTSATPTVSWTPTLPSGISQTSYRAVIYTAAQYGAATFTPGTGPSVWDSGVVSTAYVFSVALATIPVYLPNSTVYRAYVRITETGGQTSKWAYSAFTTSYTEPKQPTVTVTPVNGDTTTYPHFSLAIQGHDNLLSATDAAPTRGLGTWKEDANCVVASTTKGLTLEAIDSATMSAETASGASGYAVSGSTQYTGIASFEAVTAKRSCTVGMTWYASTGASLSTSTGTAVTDTTTGITNASVTATSPALAAFAELVATVKTANGELTPPSTPTVTPEGTTGSTTYSYEVVATNAYGSTKPSTSGSTTTGNATLSSTNYNRVAWGGVSLPAGSTGNLVYDSNLTNAIAAVGPTWKFLNGGTVGTTDGDFTVSGAGTNAAKWIYRGKGVAQSFIGPCSAPIDVTPDATYMVSATLTVPATTVNPTHLGIIVGKPTNPTSFYQYTYGTVGVNHLTMQYIPGAGVTQISLMCYQNGATVPAGAEVTWSTIQITETSTVQTYAPGPLWTYDVYREVTTTYKQIGSTTALAFDDTGQAASGTPPTANTTGERHIVTAAGIFHGTDKTWGPGGFVGHQKATALRSDTQYVRGASPKNPASFTSLHQTLTISDPEVICTQTYSYSVRVLVVKSAGADVVSPAAVTTDAKVTSTRWWEMDPTDPSTAAQAQVLHFQPQVTEQSTAHLVMGQSTPNVISNAMGGTDGMVTFWTGTIESYKGLVALLRSQKVLFISDPFGDQYGVTYARFGPQTGGLSAGVGNRVKDVTVQPSTAAAPVRTLQATFVAQPRPPV